MSIINYRQPLKRFLELIALEKKEVKSIYFFAFVSGIIYLSLPLGIQAIINFLLSGTISTSLILLTVMVVVGVFLNGWLQIMQMKINENIQRRIFTRYSLQFAYKIPRLDLTAIEDYYLPELVNRFFDIASLQKGISKILLELPAASIQVFFGLLLLSFYHPIFIAFGIFLVALMIFTLHITYKKGITTSLEESNYKYRVGYWLEEVARIIKTIKFMGRTDFPVQKADKFVSGYLDARSEHFKVLKVQYWAFVFFKVTITALLLIIGGWLVLKQQINIGQFIASEIIIITLLNSIEKIIGSLDVVYDMLTSLEKVSKILDKPTEKEDGIDISEISNSKGISIKAENLSFAYSDDDDRVLHHLNFEIKSGEKICIFGTQGSGKSTLLKLFTGGFLNYSGNLLYNNYPLGNYNLQKLRSEIGVYLGTADLFSSTLYDNLTLGDTEITTNTILSTAEQTGLLPFIQSLSNGLETRIETLGRKLPITTVNKILLTRAILTKPKLFLLEDFWSGLEAIEQEIFIKNLFSPNNEFTLIAVTNDVHFARNCDRIILLEDGKILKNGSFAELNNSEEYKRMFKHLSL
ncbi:ATP-binding cassette domain-containing protein [soil metagenome]